MPIARLDHVDIAYDERGAGEPLVLIMGLGAQLLYWPEELCDSLADAGFRVIRFDNRDVGLSSKFDQLGKPKVIPLALRRLAGLQTQAPYLLGDMADDVVALLDHLEIERAHLVGISMGGMIAQETSLRHRERVRSLTSIMSHPGDRRFIVVPPRVMAALLKPAPRTTDEAMDRAVGFYRTVGSTGFALDTGYIRERAALAFERSHYPPGFARQLAAVLASGSRSERLSRLDLPTAVLHGTVDPLVNKQGGIATAELIAGSRLRLIDGMGHDLPRDVWPIVVEEVARVAAS